MTEPRRHAPRGPVKARGPIEAVTHEGPHGQRCTAHSSRTGEPCRKWAIAGATVCRTHGGAAPQVKRAAEERLRELEMPAIERIAKLIEQDAFPSVAYQASKDVLDRLRGKAVEKIEAKVTSVEDLSDEQLQAKARELLGIG